MIHNEIYYKGSRINYQCEGAGDVTLVLLHGFMGDLRSWGSYVYKYMRDIRVVAIDLLGHGESECCGKEHSMELQADVVRAVLDHIGIRKCVMVGHSMGGYVALAFAELFPNYLQGLCLLHSHALADGEQKVKDRQRMCEIVQSNRAGFIISFIPNLFAQSNREALSEEIKELQELAINTSADSIVAAQRGMMARKSHIETLQASNYPVLFIAGRQDERIPVDMVLAQAALTPHCEVLILPNAAHMSHIEEKGLIKRKLISFTFDCFAL